MKQNSDLLMGDALDVSQYHSANLVQGRIAYRWACHRELSRVQVNLREGASR